MAQASMTIPATNFYKYTYRPSYSDYRVQILSNTEQSNGYVLAYNHGGSNYRFYLCCKFQDLTETLGTKILYRVEPTVRLATTSSNANQYVYGYPLRDKLPDVITETGVAAPSPVAAGYFPRSTKFTSSLMPPGNNFTLNAEDYATASGLSSVAQRFLSGNAAVFSPDPANTTTNYPSFEIFYTLLNGNNLYLTLYYDDTVTCQPKIDTMYGPTSGYRNPRQQISVQWTLAKDDEETYSCLGSFTTVSANIYWRETDDEQWNAVVVPANTSSYTFAANTFPVESTIEWYVSATDQAGNNATSSTYTFSTTDGTAVATPVSPAGMVVNGGIDNEFTWTVTNTTGQPQSRTVGYWSTDPNALSWNTLFDLSSDVLSYVVPAETLSGGTVYWKVQAYNQDGNAGPESDPVSISVIAPPEAPSSVTATQVPFSTVSWQSNGQRAYEISVDGIVIKKSFGSDIYSYKLVEPLPDGMHTISVRIQGPYGLWSAQASTSCNIANNPDAVLDLTGWFDVDADLTWTRTVINADPNYWVYRDGVRIGHNNKEEFTDRFVLGEHSYHVLEELPDGNYNQSQTVTGIMRSCITRIALVDGAEWIDLKLSENSNSTQSFAWSKPSTLRHMSGAVYPVAELSSFEDRTAVYDCAFPDVASGRALEAMRGKIVIIKSRGGEVMIGPLAGLEKVTGDFYIVYRFTIQQAYWEDFVDDADS